MKKQELRVELHIREGPPTPAWRRLWERLLEDNEARLHEDDERTEEGMKSDIKGIARRFERRAKKENSDGSIESSSP